VLSLRIRQAETALAGGRLDEAYELARARDVRAHRNGQRLIGRLVTALVERGRQHLSAGRVGEAIGDCGKAGILGGNTQEIADLRASAVEAMMAKDRKKQHYAQTVDAARRRVDEGRLSLAEGLIENLPSDGSQTERLLGEVNARRTAADAALLRAEKALASENWADAIAELLEARRQHATGERVTDVSAQLTRAVIEQARTAIEKGRVMLAESLVERLAPLAGDHVEVQELTWVLQQCRQAAQLTPRGELRQASEVLRQLASMFPRSEWLASALESAERASKGLAQLRSGPLTPLLTIHPDDEQERVGIEGDPPGASTPTPSGNSAVLGASLPGKFAVQVDGVGSFVVLRQGRITIGTSSTSRPIDLVLMAEPGLPAVMIERVDEDYFLTAEQPVRVNDKPTTRRLLASGDQIALSPRCRLKFAVPSPASTSAVLSLAGTRLPRSDARQVILLDRQMILGPGPSAHIRAEQLSKAAIFHIREGRLLCRAADAVMVDDRPMDERMGIPLSAHVRVGPVSLVITAAS